MYLNLSDWDEVTKGVKADIEEKIGTRTFNVETSGRRGEISKGH